MRKYKITLILLLIYPAIAICQPTKELINKVFEQQKLIKTISYELFRRDTLGSLIRTMNGKAFLERKETDTIFGFKFWSHKIGDPIEKVYDGKIGYAVNETDKNYTLTISNNDIYNLTNGGGGHMIVPDLINLDTTRVKEIIVKENDQHYILHFKYPAIEVYDITNKFKEFYIDKTTHLINSVRQHQETLGRVQDLYFELSNIKINDQSSVYDFLNLNFLTTHAHEIPIKKTNPIFGLLGKPFPKYDFKTFDNQPISTKSFKNKVVLLDFWEVWCGPCIESMPKIENLYQKYKNKGLLAFGIVNDSENVKSSRIMVKNKGFTLPMLIGNKEIQNDLLISSIPLYMIVDKAGNITFIIEGYSEIIEEEIIKALNK